MDRHWFGLGWVPMLRPRIAGRGHPACSSDPGRRARAGSALRSARIGLASLALAGGAALAHHGWGSYDASRKFAVTSAVERLEWQNPHVHIAFRQDRKLWEAVLAPPFRMNARGLSPEMIKVGTRVTVEGYPSTRVENEMRAERITVGGRTFELR